MNRSPTARRVGPATVGAASKAASRRGNATMTSVLQSLQSGSVLTSRMRARNCPRRAQTGAWMSTNCSTAVGQTCYRATCVKRATLVLCCRSPYCVLSGRILQRNQLYFQTLGIAAQGVVECCHVLRTRGLGARKV